MDIEALANVLAVLAGRLDEEPGGLDIASVRRAGEHNVTELFLGTKLIKGWLLQILQCYLIK